MKTDENQNDLLTRGGRPTLRDLLDRLEFNPAKGTISLNGERMLLTRASLGGDLRDQLIRRYSEHDAMVLMLRLGFRSGREDAEFIRQSWPHLDPGDAFTAGTRLHMVTGTVKVETISNDFDFDTDRFSGDFLWHESVEAGTYHRRHGRATKPVCWMQTGYAAGYASVFFRKLVIYKETSCSAMGHKSCRVVGKTVDGWGRDDPFVQMFLTEVLGSATDGASAPGGVRALRPTAPEDIDALIVAPVRAWLERIADSGIPALISGPPGSGRRSAARWLHHRRFPEGAFTITHAQSAELGDRLATLRQTTGQGRASGQMLTIAAIETLPPDRQWMLLDLLTLQRGRPPLVAVLSDLTPEALLGQHGFLPELAHALTILPVRMPALAERAADLPRLAERLLAAPPGGPEPTGASLTAEAAERLSRLDLPGNLPQLRTLLLRASLLAAAPGAITGDDLDAAMAIAAPRGGGAPDGLWSMLGPTFAEGTLTFDALTATLMRAALGDADGNVAAAARLLGLTRAQLAYRLKQASAEKA